MCATPKRYEFLLNSSYIWIHMLYEFIHSTGQEIKIFCENEPTTTKNVPPLHSTPPHLLTYLFFKGDLSKQCTSSNRILFQRTKKCPFYRDTPTDKLYFILSHQWHSYFVVLSLLFYILFSDILPVLYFILNHG